MSTAPDKGDGAALLLDEVRDEAHKLVAHPIEEVKRLEHVAADGESAATPLIVLIGIGLLLMVVVAVTCALALALYYTV
jgi:hypothetical protein